MMARLLDAMPQADAVNEIGRLEVLFLDGGSPAWIRTTIHGSKGRCPTIRRPGNSKEGITIQCNIPTERLC